VDYKKTIQLELFTQIIRVIFLLIVSYLYFNQITILNNKEIFTFFTILLIVINFAEYIRYLYVENHNDWRIYISPIIVCSGFVLVFQYGLTNILFITDWFNLGPLGVADGAEISSSMNKLVLLAIIGSIGLWSGYDSKLAKFLIKKELVEKLCNFFPKTIKINHGSLLVAFLLSILVRIFQESIGIFGYCSSYLNIIEAKNYTYIFFILVNLGKMGLIIATIMWISGEKNYKYWVILFWISETLLGISSGFKTSTILPTIYIFFCGLVMIKDIKKYQFIMNISVLIIVVILALNINNVYRKIAIDKKINDNCSSSDITIKSVEALLNENFTQERKDWQPKIYKDINKFENEDQINTFENNNISRIGIIFARFNFTYVGSYGILFIDHKLGEWPSHLYNLIISPIYAWVPRILWSSKPLGNTGYLYNTKILGSDTFSSTGMGPVTYLYMAGGLIPIFTIFYIIGLIQKIFTQLIYSKNQVLGAILFVTLFSNLTFIESSVDTYFHDLFRLLPINILIIYLFFVNKKNVFTKT